MFKCKECQILKDEIAYLREQNKSLQDRLIALTDLRAYGAVTAPATEDKDFYGFEDPVFDYDDYGQKIIVKE